MISDAKEIMDRLSSPSDWAVVGGAATVGLVADGAINVLPFPFFSPGMCALASASTALSLKRGVEAALNQRRRNRRRRLLRREAERCIEIIAESSEKTADDIKWRLNLDGDSLEELEAIVRETRSIANMKTFATSMEFRRLTDHWAVRDLLNDLKK